MEEESAPAARTNNQVWEAFADLFGRPSNRSLEKRRGKNVNPIIYSIAKVEKRDRLQVAVDPASYTEVMSRAGRWSTLMGDALFTEEALAKWWDTLGRGKPDGKPQLPDCDYCGNQRWLWVDSEGNRIEESPDALRAPCAKCQEEG
jgi:hypothetical protein